MQKRHEEYEVEKILDSRYRGAGVQYLVQWKGYAREHNQWEPGSNLKNAKRLVDKFHRENPEAPRRVAAVDFDQLPFRPRENFTEMPKTFKLFDWTEGRASGRRGLGGG